MKRLTYYKGHSALLALLAGTLFAFSSVVRGEEPYVLWARTLTAAWSPTAVAVSPSGDLHIEAEGKFFRFSPTGKLLSTKSHTNLFLNGVAFDALGNGYFTGNTATSGIFELPEMQGLFVAKYSPNDKLLWARSESLSAEAGSPAYGLALAVDAAENVIVLGAGRGPTSLGPYTFEPADGNRLLFCKYDRAGNLLWAKRIEGANAHTDLADLAVDSSGNILISGFLGLGAADFGGTTLYPGTSGHSHNGDFFIAKYGPDGSLRWAQLGYASSLAVDSKDNVYAAYNWAVEGESGLAKLNPGGEVLWSKTLPGVYMGGKGSLGRTPDGGVVFTGEFGGTARFDNINLRTRSNDYQDFFVAKSDPEGRIEWAIAGGGNGYDRGFTVDCDPAGSIYITGTISKYPAYFGGYTLAFIPSALPTLFAAKLSPKPTLSITATADEVILSWPKQATNYVLEASAPLSMTSWKAVTNTMVIDASQSSVQLPRSEAGSFFRLRKW